MCLCVAEEMGWLGIDLAWDGYTLACEHMQ